MVLVGGNKSLSYNQVKCQYSVHQTVESVMKVLVNEKWKKGYDNIKKLRR